MKEKAKIINYENARLINPYLLFFFLCIFLYVPSSFLRSPFPPDEFRNIYIAQNIHTARDYLFPHYVDGFYHEKPPFYFWILKLFLKFSWPTPLVLPIMFNTLISWVIVSLNYRFFKKEGFEKTGFLSSLLLATIGIFYGMNFLMRMDILFLFFIFLSIFFFWFSCREDKTSYLFLSAFFSFLAVFTKGAFGIIFPLFIGIGASIILRSPKAFMKAMAAYLLAAALVFMWLFYFSKLYKDYFSVMFFRQTISRGFDPFSHHEPFYYYLIYIIPVFLPWSFLGIGYCINGKKGKIPLWEKLYLFWFLAGFVILSVISSKLQMYLLLLAIPFCGLVGRFLSDGQDKVKKILFNVTAFFFFLSWLAAFFIFGTKAALPPTAFLSLPLFLALPFLVIKKPPRIQFRNFFIFWIILIQMLNIFYIPLASNSSDFKRIIDTIKALKVSFSNIYTTEKTLLTLSIYPLPKPLAYLEKKEDACEKASFILISKEKDFPCPLRKIFEVKEFSIFYKE